MTTALQALEITSPLGNLETYIQQVNSIPALSPQEERALATRLQEHHDLASAKQLVMAHLRFVVSIARGYSGYGLPLGDLIQEGNIGLMKAVKRFDPKVGVRLVSFAVHWIKAEIHEFIIRNWRIVKMATTKAQRKLFFNLRNSKKRLAWFNQQEVEAVAAELKVDPHQVRDMESRLYSNDITLDAEEDDNVETVPVAYLADKRYDPARALEKSDFSEQSQHYLQTALAELDGRSYHIVQQRWLVDKKATLQELADHYGVSAERIRQLEKVAMEKLKGLMTETS